MNERLKSQIQILRELAENMRGGQFWYLSAYEGSPNHDSVRAATADTIADTATMLAFARLDVLEEAARAMCRFCREEWELVHIPPYYADITMLHNRVGERSWPCAGEPIRRLQLEEWR